MDWVKRINSVLDYIEEHLDGEIDDSKIASLFASPQGTFQRMFANITDMTLSEYIRNRRLAQAANMIRHTNGKIIDVAVKYGYESAAAFSSAFKNFHGAAPSAMRNPILSPGHFSATFTLILSEQGVERMEQYNIENAEYLLRQMVSKKKDTPWAHCVLERNGVKCATDGYRVAVILPEGAGDWDLSKAYFEDPGIYFNQYFNYRHEAGMKFRLSKEQAALLLVSFSLPAASFPSPKPNEKIVCLDMNTLAIITQGEAHELAMAFNISYIEEVLKFCMCSGDEIIEVYYNGSLSPLIIKSGRLYAAILPVKLSN